MHHYNSGGTLEFPVFVLLTRVRLERRHWTVVLESHENPEFQIFSLPSCRGHLKLIDFE
jgi:hypothetical protein